MPTTIEPSPSSPLLLVNQNASNFSQMDFSCSRELLIDERLALTPDPSQLGLVYEGKLQLAASAWLKKNPDARRAGIPNMTIEIIPTVSYEKLWDQSVLSITQFLGHSPAFNNVGAPTWSVSAENTEPVPPLGADELYKDIQRARWSHIKSQLPPITENESGIPMLSTFIWGEIGFDIQHFDEENFALYSIAFPAEFLQQGFSRGLSEILHTNDSSKDKAWYNTNLAEICSRFYLDIGLPSNDHSA